MSDHKNQRNPKEANTSRIIIPGQKVQEKIESDHNALNISSEEISDAQLAKLSREYVSQGKFDKFREFARKAMQGNEKKFNPDGEAHRKKIKKAVEEAEEKQRLERMAAMKRGKRPYELEQDIPVEEQMRVGLIGEHSRALGFEYIGSRLLHGWALNMEHSLGRHQKNYATCISASVDLRALWALDPDINEEDLPEHTGDPTQSELDFYQHRESVFYLGSFHTLDGAQNYLHRLDSYLMHVLAEKGAQEMVLRLRDSLPVLEKQALSEASDQKFSDAFRQARLIQVLHKVNLNAGLKFRELSGVFMRAVLDEIPLDHERREDITGDPQMIRYLFDRDFGHYEFHNMGKLKPAQMLQRKFGPDTPKAGKVVFSGPATGENLCKYFLKRAVPAAIEQGLLDQNEMENYKDNIRSFRGVPMYDRHLGSLSPFTSSDSPGP